MLGEAYFRMNVMINPWEVSSSVIWWMMMLGLNGVQDMFCVPILVILNVSGSISIQP